jgi:hypothetical protein
LTRPLGRASAQIGALQGRTDRCFLQIGVAEGRTNVAMIEIHSGQIPVVLSASRSESARYTEPTVFMPTLVLNAPRDKVRTEGKHSFEQSLQDRVGHGYAIPLKYAETIQSTLSSWIVVLLDKYTRDRVEGKLVRLEKTGEKTSQGILRYDVHTTQLKRVPYKSESLTRTGIAVLDA